MCVFVQMYENVFSQMLLYMQIIVFCSFASIARSLTLCASPSVLVCTILRVYLFLVVDGSVYMCLILLDVVGCCWPGV